MWILLISLAGSPQAAFVSGYQTKAECEAAVTVVREGATGWRELRAAFCLPGPGTSAEKHEH